LNDGDAATGDAAPGDAGSRTDSAGVLTTPAGTFTVHGEGSRVGELVLLLHGFPQTRHTWRHQVPGLAAAGYRAVAPDQRGYSPGARPDPTDLEAYRIDQLVADTLALAEAAGCPPTHRFHLVGHDWGGAVAWMTAAGHPERLASLTVLSRPHPGAFRRAFRADTDDQRHRSRHHKGFLEPTTGPKLLEDGARRLRRNLLDAAVPPAHVEEYLSVLGDSQALEAALAWYRAATGDLAAMDAGPVTVPTLYLWGDQDASVGAGAARGTADFVAGPYRFEALAGVGHFATDQEPERVTELLLEHLAAHPARDR
jgi:pimeloyl-ACP methyl ester carboxylesterase